MHGIAATIHRFWLIALAVSLVLPAPAAVWSDEPPPAIQAEELAAVKAAEADRIRAIESVTPTVVAIYGNDRQGGGSGVLFDSAGYALTNHHVVAAAGLEGWAGLADGKLYRWNLIGTDPGGDVAVIQLAGRDPFPAAPLGDSELVRVGDWALAMGNPFTLAEDQQPTVTLGIVSGIHRYQEGSGLNQLVYGNCIQVDSSINPGNSGGPLFNLQGQVIGINGRGSFEERGRVNVGLGYAISSNQVRIFIPELLATKIAQHGTLDAVFGNRGEGVVCHTVNLDAPIARRGMQLGDRLVEFEGVPIVDANQFTNLITLYPAGWPVRVVLQRDGQQQTVHVRLTGLPYESHARPMERPAEEPSAEKPGDDHPPKEKSAKGEVPEPKMPPGPPRIQMEARPSLPLGEAGKIRDRRLNRQIAVQILQRWQRDPALGAESPRVEGLRIDSEIRRERAVIGRQVLIVARGGRVRASYEVSGQPVEVVSDGSAFWLRTPDKGLQSVSAAKALRDPHFAQGAVLESLLATDPLAHWGQLSLDGSDKAQQQLCYRLSATDASSEQLFVWLSVPGDAGAGRIELVKSGVGVEDSEPIPSTVYGDFRPVGELLVPFRRTLVRGLAENPELDIVATQCEILPDTNDALFAQPTE